jgi:dihydroorotase
MTELDLILRGGRVLDPGQGIDRRTDLGFARGRVAALGDGLAAAASTAVLDAEGCLVIPGIIDFHAHVYWGGTSLGVEADALARGSGTTTWVDAGSAGAGNLAGFQAHVIERQETRVLAFLHVSFAGIFGFSREVMVGESWDLRLLDPLVCAGIAKRHPDLVRGIKVRVGAATSGPNGLQPLALALEAAELAGLPVMCHIDRPPPRLDEVLALLRPGDVLTHAFRPAPNAPVLPGGEVRAAVRQARERGVVFDIGHGMGSFAFETAEAMLAAGFLPDVISSDVHALCVAGPAHDNLVTMTKFLDLGMPLAEIVRAVTATPARLLRRPDLGSLAVGSTGDTAVLAVDEGAFDLVDTTGRTRRASRRFRSAAVVLGGRLWHVAPEPQAQSETPNRRVRVRS